MMKKKAKNLVALLAFTAFFTPGPWRAESVLHAMPPIQKIVLPNQLVVLFMEEHSLPFATFRLLINAGSWRDPSGSEGLANLTAKSVLLGTSAHSAAELNQALDFMGSSIEVSCDKDYVTFGMQILKKDFDKGVDLLLESITRPIFPEDEIKREAANILGTIRSEEDQPMEVAEKAFQKALFGADPYSHPVEGTSESIPTISREAVAQFHQSFYHPNTSILAVVGDITLDELKANILPRLEKWSPGKIPETPFRSSFNEGQEVVKINRPITQANIMLGHQGVERSNKDYYAITVMNFILGGGDFSSRLLEEIRIKRGLVYFVGSAFIPRKHPGSFVVTLQTKNSSARESISLAIQEMKRMQEQPPSEQEIETAKKYLIGSFPLRFATQRNLADFITQVEFYGLGLDYPEKYPSLIGAVSRDDVLRVARAYLHPENCIQVIVGNLKEAGME